MNKQNLGLRNSFGVIRPYSWNKDDVVCICNHSCKDDGYADSFKIDVNEKKYRQSAFDVFVYNDYSIILDTRFLDLFMSDRLDRRYNLVSALMELPSINPIHSLAVIVIYNSAAYVFATAPLMRSYSIILDNSILNDYDYLKRGMIGEYQVFGNISLSYIRGIGVPNYIQRMLDSVEGILDKYDSFNFKHRLDFWVKKLENIENLDEFGSHFFAYNDYVRVFELLEKYGYDVEVVDPVTGLDWKSKDIMYEEVKRVKSRAKSKGLIK